MKKTMKRISTIALGATIVLGSLALAAPAFAGNTSNTYFTFNLPWTGATYGTGWRAKEDSSSTFVCATTVTNMCQLYVDGSRDGGSPVNCTVNGSAFLREPGSYQIYQDVNEWGYNEARLTSWAQYGPAIISGYWSPDSYGTYPIINDGY